MRAFGVAVGDGNRRAIILIGNRNAGAKILRGNRARRVRRDDGGVNKRIGRGGRVHVLARDCNGRRFAYILIRRIIFATIHAAGCGRIRRHFFCNHSSEDDITDENSGSS